MKQQSRALFFNSVMALAAIRHLKTETRRPLKHQPFLESCPDGYGSLPPGDWWFWETPTRTNGLNRWGGWATVEEMKAKIISGRQAPFGLPGTELWLREPGIVTATNLGGPQSYTVDIKYPSDGAVREVGFPKRLHVGKFSVLPKWARLCRGIPNGIFREAARFKTVVLEVCVERLWNITEAGAIAEGVEEAVKFWLGKYAQKWEPQCWLSHDHGESYCRACAEKEVRKLRREGLDVEVDGGYSGASMSSDIFENCSECGKLLETSVLDPSDYLPVDGVYDGYLTAEEIAMIFNYGGGDTPCLELPNGYAREAYRVLWDMIYGKRPGLAWDDNPWVSVTKFSPMEAIA